MTDAAPDVQLTARLPIREPIDRIRRTVVMAKVGSSHRQTWAGTPGACTQSGGPAGKSRAHRRSAYLDPLPPSAQACAEWGVSRLTPYCSVAKYGLKH